MSEPQQINLDELFEKIESCNFECEAGNLTMCAHWDLLKSITRLACDQMHKAQTRKIDLQYYPINNEPNQ